MDYDNGSGATWSGIGIGAATTDSIGSTFQPAHRVRVRSAMMSGLRAGAPGLCLKLKG